MERPAWMETRFKHNDAWNFVSSYDEILSTVLNHKSSALDTDQFLLCYHQYILDYINMIIMNPNEVLGLVNLYTDINIIISNTE